MSIGEKGILLSPELFEKFFKQYYSIFCNHAYKYLSDKNEAEEIVQEVLARIWEKRYEIEVKGNLLSYIYLSIKHTCINYLKHKKIITEYQKTHESNEYLSEIYETSTIELESKIMQAIDSLPPKRKQIFLMSRIDQLKYQEIAEKLNLSVKTVETHMGLALKQLRDKLKDYL